VTEFASDNKDQVERSSGRLVSVTAEAVGAFLTADAASGSTLLEVDDAGVFDEIAGGTVQVNGSQFTYQPATVDNIGETVTIDGGLDADAAEGDRVDVVDESTGEIVQKWTAQVALPGAAASSPITALVSQALTIQIAQGNRDVSPGESVTMELRGTQWVIIDAPGSAPPSGHFIVAANDPKSVPQHPGFSGPYRSPMYVDGDVVLAHGVAGEDYPRFRMDADTGGGMWWNDGTMDPGSAPGAVAGGGANLWYDSTNRGLRLDAAVSSLQLFLTKSLLDLFGTDAPDAHAQMRVDSDGAVVYVKGVDGQTGDLIDAFVPGQGAFSVSPFGAVVAGTFTTADRPTGQGLGAQIFDSTLMKPIWSDGSGGWVDATGTAV
jgi:hypothetical protein